MSEQKPIRHADLAHHWGCSAANVSNLVKRHAMPAFTSLADADAWRAVHAPPRKPRETSPKKTVEGQKKSRGPNDSTTAPGTTPATPGTGAGTAETFGDKHGPPAVTAPPERIDVEKFIDRGGDFVELMLTQAKEAPQIVYGLLKLRMAAGEPGAIAAASKNWHEAAGHAADVLERFLKIQKEAGTLLSIDDVADVLLTELQEVRKNFKKLGQRYAAVANPQNPPLAQKAFEAAVDAALAPADAAIDRVRLEVVAPTEASPAA